MTLADIARRGVAAYDAAGGLPKDITARYTAIAVMRALSPSLTFNRAAIALAHALSTRAATHYPKEPIK
jgi:hypothetical protein